MSIELKTNRKFQMNAGDLQFNFMNSGDLFEVAHQSTMINQLKTNPIDGSLNNLYLRLFQSDRVKVTPLIGIHSDSEMSLADSTIKWNGQFDNVRYEVRFILTDSGIWFWDVKLSGDAEFDLIYGQDLGLADKGAVRSNEAYMSQYIDHTVYEDDQRGYIVCSRQNQPQQSGFPYIQQGSLNKVKGYSTDGFQFFGTSYRETNEPEALTKAPLDNEIYQYEFAYIALQTERKPISAEEHVVFYGLYKEDHPEAVDSLEFQDQVLAARKKVEETEDTAFQPVHKVSLSPEIGSPLQTEAMTEDEINSLFPERQHEERQDDTLLSFFTDKHEHVILKEKERLVERPHGHILTSGHNHRITENVMTTTSYMTGVFNSQLVVGNTSFNKMLTNTRNALNIMKTSGQRLYIEIDGTYRLLTMPSLFEIGFNYTCWYYKIPEDTIIVTNFTTVDTPEVRLNVRPVNDRSYRFLLSNQITMNNNEYEVPYTVEENDETFTFSAANESDSAATFPKLCYRMKVDGAQVQFDSRNSTICFYIDRTRETTYF